jgi:hypothetical protein
MLPSSTLFMVDSLAFIELKATFQTSENASQKNFKNFDALKSVFTFCLAVMVVES